MLLVNRSAGHIPIMPSRWPFSSSIHFTIFGLAPRHAEATCE